MKATIVKVTKSTDSEKTSSCVIKSYVNLAKHSPLFVNLDVKSLIKGIANVTYDAKKQRLNIISVGVTSLCNNDTFNELKGLRIAECHAKRSLFLTMRQFNKMLLNYYKRLGEECVSEIDRYNNLALNEKKHIGELDSDNI